MHQMRKMKNECKICRRIDFLMSRRRIGAIRCAEMQNEEMPDTAFRNFGKTKQMKTIICIIDEFSGEHRETSGFSCRRTCGFYLDSVRFFGGWSDGWRAKDCGAFFTSFLPIMEAQRIFVQEINIFCVSLLRFFDLYVIIL